MARRDTRSLILQVSLDLFNQSGEPNVSTNLIALEADISPGNLYYHFRSKDDIALDLFKQFLGELQPLLHLDESMETDVEALWLRLHLVFETMGRFRFVYRNLGDLKIRMPDLGTAFSGLLKMQHDMLTQLFSSLESSANMTCSDLEREALADNMLLTMTYWIPYAELRKDSGFEDGSVLAAAVSRTLLLIAPYLHEPDRSKLTSLAGSYLD
ncbi:MAG: TetR/AcrR family transcriptional regulator [Xanthomonadales bacterium]|nr:TetR/AcrR family transcriptional regulator [Xanthomonadales bacterium]